MSAGASSPEPSTSAGWLVTTVHNRTQPSPTMPVLEGSPALQVWGKASTVRVSLGSASWAKGPKPQPPPLRPGGEDEACPACAGGSAAPGDQQGGRSAIGTMSKGSRRRFMQKLATIDRDAPAVFITLTWPSWAAPDRKQWHRAWDRWRKRLSRDWPSAAGLWRREFTRAGTVHLHLILFGVATDPAVIRQLQRWTAAAWADSVDAPEYERRLKAGTRVEVPRIGAAVSRYIAKYCSKAAAGDGTDRPMGRWWGTFGGASRIPYTLPMDVPLTESEGHQIRRTMERWLASKRRQRTVKLGIRVKGQPPRPRASRRIFTDNPGQWLRLLEVLREPSQVPPVGASRRVRVGAAEALTTRSPTLATVSPAVRLR